jgi:hypothetical protein
MTQAILYLVIFAALQILPGSLLTVLWPLTGSTALTTTDIQIISMVVSALLVFLVFIRLKWACPTRDYLLSRPWVVVFWCVIAAIGVVIPSTWLQEQLPELPNLIEAELGDILLHRGGYFVVCILAPLAEELAFRGAILRTLLAWRPANVWPMIAVSAFFFALIHMNPAQMPHAFLMGLLLGWMYVRTGSIVPGVAFHWANNTVAYLLFRAYPDPSMRLADYFSGDTRAVGAAVIFSLFILVPAIYQLHLFMRRPKAA